MVVLGKDYISIEDLCSELSISVATGRNWIRLGKITPEPNMRNVCFSKNYLNELKNSIGNGNNLSLKSRRNKKFIGGNKLYESYVAADSKNIQSVRNLLNYIEESNIKITDGLICYLLSDCAKKLAQKSDISCSELINDIEKYAPIKKIDFDASYTYDEKEDTLGLLYISLKNMSKRKASGAYFTPTVIVKKLCNELFKNDNNIGKTVCDPCCGTGNFLLNLPDSFAPENIYGGDIDALSVYIARINLALRYKLKNTDILYSNIKIHNYLVQKSEQKFDYIIGNPPWGCDFSVKEKSFLRSKYKSAVGSNIESFDVVLEQALSDLSLGGVLSFVLPESILNVKSHKKIRQIIMAENSIRYMEFLGDAFDNVQCPSVILQIEHTCEPFNTMGLKIKEKNKEYKIKTRRMVTDEIFSFATTDEEYEIIQKIENIKNKVTLKNNAKFALGIVTGDNKKYISNKRNDSNEIVLKGSDIYKFKFSEPQNYITFKPERFQQVAPAELYRAEEKLLYRFISGSPIFAYDDNKTLSLNSCNVLIPEIEGLSIKYIMAILNSSVAEFYYKKQFKSVKVLRSYIEQIPIPFESANVQNEIVEIVDKIIQGNSSLYELLDKKIAMLYQITKEEYSIILSQLA